MENLVLQEKRHDFEKILGIPCRVFSAQITMSLHSSESTRENAP